MCVRQARAILVPNKKVNQVRDDTGDSVSKVREGWILPSFLHDARTDKETRTARDTGTRDCVTKQRSERQTRAANQTEADGDHTTDVRQGFQSTVSTERGKESQSQEGGGERTAETDENEGTKTKKEEKKYRHGTETVGEERDVR